MSDDRERAEERRPVHFRIIFDNGLSWTAAWVENASEHGLYLAAPGPVPVGAILRLEPSEKALDPLFEVNARVVRCDPLDDHTTDPAALDGAYGIALELIYDPKRDMAEVTAMLARLQAQARG